jgi:hypothetical protein
LAGLLFDEAVVEGKKGELEAVVHAKLIEDAGDVVFDGLFADNKLGGNLLV